MAKKQFQAQGTADFDWDAFEKGSVESSMSQEDLTQAYNQTLNKVNNNDVVEGTVISMNKREVVVNIGYKSDGIVSMNEFRYNPDLKVGDKVEVYIESQEDKKGQLILHTKEHVLHVLGIESMRLLRRTR